jgi:hypothetical protein
MVFDRLWLSQHACQFSQEINRLTFRGLDDANGAASGPDTDGVSMSPAPVPLGSR